MEYKCKLHVLDDISQYKILSLFFATKYTRVSRKIILNYTSVTHTLQCAQHRYKGNTIIIHMIYSKK